ncbi:MAG: glycosyltransferase family 4 protein [Bacillota bacterium]|nr:glycosyltransferase family 4 protein [Bacillota bacterium]
MKYCVLYPETKNVHLIKDVGMIAYKLWKLYGVESSVACYNNDSYEYANSILKGLNIEFLHNRFKNDILDGAAYLKKNSRHIDVLQLFHVTLRSIIYTAVYKHYNKKGKLFLKLDCTEELLDKIRKLGSVKGRLFKYFFKKVDIIGVEQRRLFEELKYILPDFSMKIHYTPNGMDYDHLNADEISFKDKKDIILQVGRIGSKEKNSEMLVEAFIRMKNAENSHWKLKLVGETTEEFQKFLSKIITDRPDLGNGVECVGPIYDRERLMEVYKESKIFCLTSRFESFGIALMEAAACGNVIISTNVGIAREFVMEGGRIVEDEDIEGLAKVLEEYTQRSEVEDICYRNITYTKENFNWDVIVKDLYEKIVGDGE